MTIPEVYIQVKKGENFFINTTNLSTFPCGEVQGWFHSLPTSALEAG
jgi:hypothetical protein